ncbi:MAG: glycoside hydrolase family 43 protein [Chloroflexi bacterium]|nr:glycoside hydrolase family 43 protein [Chloroflexota bacterium]
MRITYRNPVWPDEMADPFVLKWQGEYYAYGTSSLQADHKIFPILHSKNLADWTHIGNAVEPLPTLPHGNYWAPEVAERDGKFYMYFSAGERTADETQRLHAAVADSPRGPFITRKQLMPDAGFTIDAHPFRDPQDGQWYLFFCQDFFDERVGTGIAVVRLADTMLDTVGAPTPLLRASGDWQIYERNRTIYSQTWAAWHTVEGPFVTYHAGHYYCFYSGGAWHSFNYGVSYGVADHVLGPYHESQKSNGPRVLQAVPDTVLGPGHNSIVLGPDGHTEFLVYHAWDAARTARRMCIDPLRWTTDGPVCAGPTISEQVIEL